MAKRILFFLMFIQLCSCSKDKLLDNPQNTTFYPLVDGNFWEYQVDKTSYSVTDDPVRESYLLKEVLFQSDENNFTLKVFKKENENADWLYLASDLIKIEGNKLLRTENGIVKVSLVFPIQENNEWNENLFNNGENKPLHIESFGQAFDIYPSTFKVVQTLDSSLIHKDAIYRVFGKDLGLVYSENTQIKYCQSSPDCIGSGKVDFGFSETRRLIRQANEL